MCCSFVRLLPLFGLLVIPRVLPAAETNSSEVGDPDVKKKERLEEVAALAKGKDAVPKLLGILDDFELTSVQSVAVLALSEHPTAEVGQGIVQRWRSIKPGARIPAVQLLVAHPAWRKPLLAALEKGAITPAELALNAAQRITLLDDKDPEISKVAAKFFERQDFAGRKKIIGKILTDLPAEGNLREGSEIYRQRCLMCHRHGRLGNPVGPDLSVMGQRSAEEIITNFVDPNYQINPSFVTCEVTRKNGNKVLGVLVQESSDAVILVHGLGLRETIPWSDIKAFKTAPKSLMPEGLESAMSPEDFRGLVQFLQGAEATKAEP